MYSSTGMSLGGVNRTFMQFDTLPVAGCLSTSTQATSDNGWRDWQQVVCQKQYKTLSLSVLTAIFQVDLG